MIFGAYRYWFCLRFGLCVLNSTILYTMTKHHLFAIVLSLIVVAGCGGEFIPTGGKITFDDNTPVPFGGVVFETDSFMADGQIKPDGTYTLSSLKPGDGLPAGTYKVSISAVEYDADERQVIIVHPKFSDPNTSGLTAVVSKGQSRFDFTVTRP